MPHDVMVGECPARPAVRRADLELLRDLAHLFRRQRIGRQEVEGVAHVDTVIATGVFGEDFHVALAVADFAHRGGRRELVEYGAEALEELDIFRLALVVEVVLIIVWIDRRRRLGVALLGR